MSFGKVSSTGSRNRKNMKPVMERKRRARINTSLAELKSLLIEVIQSEGARQNKMEKADILEMTVRHLRKVKRKPPLAPQSESTSRINKYRLGFSECAVEVSKYLEHTNGLETDFRARLLNHLVEVSMNPGQDNENEFHASTVPIRSHQRSLLEDRSKYCQDANIIGSAGQYPETTQKKEIDNNGNYVMRDNEAGQTPANSMKDIHINTTHISSGEMAYLVPAASLLQYSGSTVSGPKVFLQVIQPQNSSSTNTNMSDGSMSKVSAGIPCPGNIVASQAMVTPIVPNMTFVKQLINPVCPFIQVVPKEYTLVRTCTSDSQSSECAHIQPSDSQSSECAHIQPSDSQSSECAHIQPSDSQSECAHIQPSDSQSECAHIQPSDSQSSECAHIQPSDSQSSECAHIQPSDSQSECADLQLSDCKSVGNINENESFNALNKVTIQKSQRVINYDNDNCSISIDCMHEEVKTTQVWRPW